MRYFCAIKMYTPFILAIAALILHTNVLGTQHTANPNGNPSSRKSMSVFPSRLVVVVLLLSLLLLLLLRGGAVSEKAEQPNLHCDSLILKSNFLYN